MTKPFSGYFRMLSYSYYTRNPQKPGLTFIGLYSRMVLLVSAMMLFGLPMQVHAATGNGGSADPESVGLIVTYSYNCVSGNKRVLINADVYAKETMAQIGFKNIKVQQSSTGTGGWTTYFAPSDQVVTDAITYSLVDFLISVPDGYYYRFELTNYAKEYGWFFPRFSKCYCDIKCCLCCVVIIGARKG